MLVRRNLCLASPSSPFHFPTWHPQIGEPAALPSPPFCWAASPSSSSLLLCLSEDISALLLPFLTLSFSNWTSINRCPTALPSSPFLVSLDLDSLSSSFTSFSCSYPSLLRSDVYRGSLRLPIFLIFFLIFFPCCAVTLQASLPCASTSSSSSYPALLLVTRHPPRCCNWTSTLLRITSNLSALLALSCGSLHALPYLQRFSPLLSL